jgi:2-polyprenyl-3-methyl-5-hydroxy-6-metoxy-1,4-benzoquinol methylase
MNIDLMNSEFYNEYSEFFDKIPFEDSLILLILKYLPNPGSILEIGAGAGALAAWMVNQGYEVACLEPAEKPAEKARLKGLNVITKRFQDYSSSSTFDGIIAISSLIHIPRSEMPLQIEKLSQLIKHEGTIILSFIEGQDEGYEDPTGKGKMRFFSKFTQDELEALLTPYFSIVESQKIEVKKMNQSFYLMVLKAI